MLSAILNKKTLNIGPYELKISRRKKSLHQISVDHIKEINVANKGKILSTSMAALLERVQSVQVPSLECDQHIRAAIDCFSRNGVVIIPDFIKQENVSAEAEQVRAWLAKYIDKLEGDFYEDNQVITQRGAKAISGYKNLASSSKTVLQVRDGQDRGMIDIFNWDFIGSPSTEAIRSAFESDAVMQIIDSFSAERLNPKNLNIYANKGVTETRGFHVDTWNTQVKAFIYLTDVTSLSEGPYTYILESHKESAARDLSKAISKTILGRTDTPFVDIGMATPALGMRGTLIISDQSGSHMGFPQAPSSERIAAVMNYGPGGR